MNILQIALTLFILLNGKSTQDSRLLFNGVSMDGWEVIDYEGHGDVSITDSCFIINSGNPISGIKWIDDFPTTNYEINLEANRIEGSDFFCGMTFPVKDSFLTLIIGGWGGTVVGLSNIDYYDAYNNMTARFMDFESGFWYPIRLKVTNEKIEVWINGDKVVDFKIGNYKLSLRMEMDSSKPYGIATYKTTAALRNIRLNMIPE